MGSGSGTLMDDTSPRNPVQYAATRKLGPPFVLSISETENKYANSGLLDTPTKNLPRPMVAIDHGTPSSNSQ